MSSTSTTKSSATLWNSHIKGYLPYWMRHASMWAKSQMRYLLAVTPLMHLYIVRNAVYSGVSPSLT